MSRVDVQELELIKLELGQAHRFGATLTPYLALLTAASNDASPGTEAAYSGYARVALAAKFPAATNPVSNTAEVRFAAVTGGSVTVVGADIYDAATGGNRLRRLTNVAATTFATGVEPYFPVGQITVGTDD